MEEVGEGNARHVVSVNSSASRCTDDLNADDGRRCVRRWAETLVDPIEQDWNRAAGQLTVAFDAKHRCLLTESWLHDAAFGLLAALNVLVQYLGDGLIFLNVSRFAHVITLLHWIAIDY